MQQNVQRAAWQWDSGQHHAQRLLQQPVDLALTGFTYTGLQGFKRLFRAGL